MTLAPYAPYPVEDGPLGLMMFAARCAPRWANVAWLAVGCESGAREYDRAVSRVAQKRPRLSENESTPLVLRELEERRKWIEYRRRHIIRDKLTPLVRGAWASGHYVLRGTDQGGSDAVLPARLAQVALIDIEANTVAAPDGSLRWSMVTIEKSICSKPPAAKPAGSGRPHATDQNAGLVTAIRERFKRGEMPGKTIGWKAFCDAIRSDIGVTSSHRGCSDKSIQRVVGHLTKDN
jgi:hypothetical protein